MPKGNRLDRRRERSREQWEQHKATTIVYLLLRLIVVLSLVSAALRGAWESVFICVLTLLLFTLPALVERSFRVELPDTLQIVVFFFIFASQILGELQAWYVRIPGWDTLMHTINGFLAAAIGFSLVDLLNRSERVGVNLSPAYLSLVAVCFSMTVGVLWEFFEFAMDSFFLQDMQKDTVLHTISSMALDPSAGHPTVIRNIQDAAVNGESLGLSGYLDIGLYDTMKDLFVNFLGAVVFSVIGYFYIKNRGRHKFAERFIPVVLPEENVRDGRLQTPPADGEGAGPEEDPPAG